MAVCSAIVFRALQESITGNVIKTAASVNTRYDTGSILIFLISHKVMVRGKDTPAVAIYLVIFVEMPSPIKICIPFLEHIEVPEFVLMVFLPREVFVEDGLDEIVVEEPLTLYHRLAGEPFQVFT